ASWRWIFQVLRVWPSPHPFPAWYISPLNRRSAGIFHGHKYNEPGNWWNHGQTPVLESWWRLRIYDRARPAVRVLHRAKDWRERFYGLAKNTSPRFLRGQYGGVHCRDERRFPLWKWF